MIAVGSMSSSWFGGAGITEQFSSLTGQISNFTKEVLTEATQEVEGREREIKDGSSGCYCICTDPVTELQIAVKRVNELQTQNSELSSKVLCCDVRENCCILHFVKLEQVKKRRDEETERADTAEFQVSTISQEYRKLLQQKEVNYALCDIAAKHFLASSPLLVSSHLAG